MNKGLKIYIVPHTHWDKEWYFIKDVSDVYLIDNMKNILNLNQKNPDEALFCWDGQYSVVDDYLKFFPKEYSKIKDLVANKKLIIGPWYSQTDTFNVLGESIIRNLLIGTKLSEELGHTMQVAYLPDTFGFNSNLPQIIAKTNNKGIINWRGAEDGLLNNELFNLWEAEDGTKFPVYNLYRHGYFTGVGGLLNQYHKNWSKDKDVNWDPDTQAEKHAQFFLDFLQKELEILVPHAKSTNNRILIPVGSDQMPMVTGWKKVIKAMNEIDPTNEYILADFEKFMIDVTSDTEVMSKAQTITGQFRYGKYARAHKTITSARYDIKKLSRHVENLLYKNLEPLAVMYKQLGGDYPKEIILEASKLLVSCHAHDSIGGCNTDETNRAIIARLESATGLIEGQITLIKKRIVESLPMNKNDIILFNLEPFQTEKKFNIKVNTKKPGFKLSDGNKEIKYAIEKQLFFDNDAFKIVDSSVEFINYDQNNYSNKNDSDANATNILLEDASGRFQTTINFKVPINGFGYKIISLAETEEEKNIYNSGDNFIENDYFKIEVINNQINLFDKIRKVQHDNIFKLEAHIDAGDTYDFSPPQKIQENIEVIKSLKFYKQKSYDQEILNFSIDYGFKDVTFFEESYAKQTQAFNVQIILKEKQIDFKINLENNVKNIRWRAVYNSEIKNSQYSFADQSFAVCKRLVHDEKINLGVKENWVDVPVEIEACESLVYLQDDKKAFAVFTNGTNEYQITGNQDKDIAVTLFRGVSRIGNRDLLYRKGRASGINDYPHATPESNLLKQLEFSLSLYITNDANELNVLAKENSLDSIYYQKQSMNQFQWKGDTFVLSQNKLKNKNVTSELELLNISSLNNMVVTSIREAWDEQATLIRFYNSTNKAIEIKDATNLVAEYNLMDEKMSTKNLVINPNEIKTFSVKFK